VIWAEGVFDFRESMIGSCIGVLRRRKGARENEVKELDRKRVIERRTDEEGHLKWVTLRCRR
jgi:hypothetical protein